MLDAKNQTLLFRRAPVPVRMPKLKLSSRESNPGLPRTVRKVTGGHLSRWTTQESGLVCFSLFPVSGGRPSPDGSHLLHSFL